MEAARVAALKFSTLAGVADFEFPRLRVIVSTELAGYKRVPHKKRPRRHLMKLVLIAFCLCRSPLLASGCLCAATVRASRRSVAARLNQFHSLALVLVLFPDPLRRCSVDRGTRATVQRHVQFLLTLVWLWLISSEPVNGVNCVSRLSSSSMAFVLSLGAERPRSVDRTELVHIERRKELVAVEDVFRESTDSWLFRSQKATVLLK